MSFSVSSHRAAASRDGSRGSFLSLAATLVWPLQAAVIAFVIGGLLSGPKSGAVGIAALAFLGLAALRTGLETAAQRDLASAAEARIADLREAILERETRAAAASGIGGPGALAALSCEKLETLRPYLLRYRPARLKSAVVPMLILAIALWHSWAVALVLLMAGPLIPVFMALVGWAAKAASDRQMVEIGQLSDLLVDRLAALSDLRLIGAGGALVEGFAETSESLRARSMVVLKIAFLSSTVLELFAALGVAMVAIWVGFTLLGELGWGSWGGPLSPAMGIYLLLLAPEFFQPLRDLAAAWHDRAAAEAVLDEIDRWQREERPVRLGHGRTGGLDAAPVSLRLTGLCHRGLGFPDIEIAPGARIAVTGPSGCGKTTLLRLIAGLERPEAGQILLSGHALDEDTATAWRCRIGWMPQAPHFLNRSLRHNIGFGDPVRPEVLRAAHLDALLAGLPKGDLTLLGERGAGLSGGEARRVTLARAMHGAPQMILADEPTADLDARTAAAISNGLMGFARAGGTLVIATHDRDLAARMDSVIRLDRSRGAAP